MEEAGARFPGHVGQTIVLGAVIASLIDLGNTKQSNNQRRIRKIENFHHGKFMSITGIGLVLVFIFNILMIAVQSIRLEASPIDAIQTNFGNIWIIRMIITIILLGIWFGLDRKRGYQQKIKFHFLLHHLLIGTSTLIGHGAASGETPAISFRLYT